MVPDLVPVSQLLCVQRSLPHPFSHWLSVLMGRRRLNVPSDISRWRHEWATCSEGPARLEEGHQDKNFIKSNQDKHNILHVRGTGWGVTSWGVVLLKNPGSPVGPQIYNSNNAKKIQDSINRVTESKRIIPAQSVPIRLCLNATFSNVFCNTRKESLGCVQEKTQQEGAGAGALDLRGACSAWGTQEQHTVPEIPPGRRSQAPYGGAKLRNNRQRS